MDKSGLLSAARVAERLLRALFVAMAVLATAAGTAIVCLIGASVTMRYLAFAPFRFTEELVGLLMTAAFFLALPLVTYRAEHVRVTVLVKALPPNLRRFAALAAGIFGAWFCFWFFALSMPWLEFAYDRAIRTEVGRLLMYPWMALFPVSLSLTAIAFVIRSIPDPERPSRAV